MSWPLSHEFNEAIQSPKATMSDPDLRAAEVVVGATGLPLPRSGNFADVYQFRAPDGREWAVKCFTRPVVGLAERYAKLSAALAAAELPFAVGFQFLAEGIRVGGAWRPILKMDWVEGLLLNQLVRDNTASQKVLGALGQMWSRLSKRLREAGFAHADVQHGNVLLVPGARAGAYGLKLIDYDGMWVKALANNPSGEVGHPSYQHPERARTRAYSPDLDRFPHLAVATALRGLAALGPALWDRYDNGDNMLFGEADFRAPSESPLMRELWHAGDAGLSALVGRLAVACGKPIPQTPWLDLIAPEGDPVPLTDAEHRAALEALGLPVPVPAPVPALPPEPVAPVSAGWVEVPPPAPASDVELVEVEPVAAPPAPPAPAFEVFEADNERTERRTAKDAPRKQKKKQKQKQSSRVPLYAGAGVAAVLAVVTAVVLLKGGGKPPEVAEEPKEPPVTGPADPAPKNPPKKIDERKDQKVEPTATAFVPTNPRVLWTYPLGSSQATDLFVHTGAGVVHWRENNRTVRTLDLLTGKPRSGYEALETVSGHLCELPNGRAVEYGVSTSEVIGWNLGTGRSEWRANLPGFDQLPPAGRHQNGLAVSPNRRFFAVGEYTFPPDPKRSRPLRVYAETKVLVETTWDGSGAVCFTSDSRLLVCETSGTVRWFQLPTGALEAEWKVPFTSGLITARPSVAPDEKVIGLIGRTPSGDGPHVLDARTGRVIHGWTGYGTPAFSADGRWFAAQANSAVLELRVMSLASGSVLCRFPLPESANAVRLSNDGRYAVLTFFKPARIVTLDLHAEGDGTPLRAFVARDVPPRWARATGTRTNHTLIIDDEVGCVHMTGADRRSLDLTTGKPREGFTDLTRIVAAVQPLGNGRLQRSYTNGSKIEVLELPTGKSVGEHTIPAFLETRAGGQLDNATLSPTERYLAVARTSLSMTTGAVLPVQVRAEGKVILDEKWRGGTVYFSADEKRVLLAESNGHLRWFRLPSGTPDVEVKIEHKATLAAPPIVAPDGETVCVCTGPNGWALHRTKTGEQVAAFANVPMHALPVYSKDGKRVAVAALQPVEVRVHAVADGTTLAKIPNQRVYLMALSQNGSLLAITDADNPEVLLYDLTKLGAPSPEPKVSPKDFHELAGTPVELVSKWKAELGALKPDRAALVPAANLLALGASEGGFATVDLTKGEVRNTGFITLRSVPLADLVPLDRGQLASLAPKATEFRIWDAKAGSPRASTARLPDLPAGAGDVRAALSPDAKWVAVGRLGGPDAPLRIADAQTPNKPLVSTTWKGGTIHFTPDGSRVLLAEEEPNDRRVSCKGHWFQLPSGKPGGSVALPSGARVDTLSADGKRLVIAKPEHTTPHWRRYVLNGDTAGVVLPLPLHYSHQHPVALSPDGKRLAALRTTGAGAPAVELIDVDAGALVATAKLESADVSALALTPDGKSLYVVSQKASAVWAFTVPPAPKP